MWEYGNFDRTLHLKKQIKIQLIQRHEHEAMSITMDLLAEQPLVQNGQTPH